MEDSLSLGNLSADVSASQAQTLIDDYAKDQVKLTPLLPQSQQGNAQAVYNSTIWLRTYLERYGWNVSKLPSDSQAIITAHMAIGDAAVTRMGTWLAAQCPGLKTSP